MSPVDLREEADLENRSVFDVMRVQMLPTLETAPCRRDENPNSEPCGTGALPQAQKAGAPLPARAAAARGSARGFRLIRATRRHRSQSLSRPSELEGRGVGGNTA